MPVVSVSDPRLASKVGTRTWGTRLADLRETHPIRHRAKVGRVTDPSA